MRFRSGDRPKRTYEELKRSFDDAKRPWDVKASRKEKAALDLRASLAKDDLAVKNFAGLIDLDHIKDTGQREAAFKGFEKACKRYNLDPATAQLVLHSLYPDLEHITPPVPELYDGTTI